MAKKAASKSPKSSWRKYPPRTFTYSGSAVRLICIRIRHWFSLLSHFFQDRDGRIRQYCICSLELQTSSLAPRRTSSIASQGCYCLLGNDSSCQQLQLNLPFPKHWTLQELGCWFRGQSRDVEPKKRSGAARNCFLMWEARIKVILKTCLKICATSERSVCFTWWKRSAIVELFKACQSHDAKDGVH
jgi:hypothetical protein